MRFKSLVLPSLVLGGAALLIAPGATSHGFSLIGDDLPLAQRDFRVFNNFSKAKTNDNLTPDDNFPGHQGAVMAIWKGCMEWSSELHGSGNGDPHQPGDLGSGGANFDPSFQGNASSVGTSTNNIHSQISGGDGGVLAFAEGGLFSGGAWRIRYYEKWEWEDGPASPAFGDEDLQGVAVHEYGHALGLGHSDVITSTMWPSISGTGAAQRSIEADDIAGVKAIYGSKSSTKPRINSIDVSGTTLTIHGEDFSSSSNEVWFTNANTTTSGSNPFVKLTGVSSSDSGTRIDVVVPGTGGPGDVMVRKNGTSHSSLSNAWPFDPSGTPGAPLITGLTPSSVPVVFLDPVVVTVAGNGFDTITGVFFEGAGVDYSTIGDTSLTFQLPVPSAIGPKTIQVDTFGGSASTSLDVTVTDPPVLLNKTPLVFSGVSGEFAIGALPGSAIFLAGSPNNTPSVLPGLISADIGAGFTTITLLGVFTTPASGKVELSVLTAGLPPFSQLYFQAAVLDTLGTLPMPVSNVASLIII